MRIPTCPVTTPPAIYSNDSSWQWAETHRRWRLFLAEFADVSYQTLDLRSFNVFPYAGILFLPLEMISVSSASVIFLHFGIVEIVDLQALPTACFRSIGAVAGDALGLIESRRIIGPRSDRQQKARAQAPNRVHMLRRMKRFIAFPPMKKYPFAYGKPVAVLLRTNTGTKM